MPQLVAKYNKEIAGNDSIELIHASFDSDDKSAGAWAKKSHFTWPTVMERNLEKAGLVKYSQGVPTYVVVDANGKVVAEGKDAVSKKIKEITKK